MTAQEGQGQRLFGGVAANAVPGRTLTDTTLLTEAHFSDPFNP